MSLQLEFRMSTACAVARLLLCILVPSPGDALRRVRSFLEATPLGARLPNRWARTVPPTAQHLPPHSVPANPSLRTAIPSPSDDPRPVPASPLRASPTLRCPRSGAEVQPTLARPRWRPKSAPPRVKSFLEKTLMRARATHFTPHTARPAAPAGDLGSAGWGCVDRSGRVVSEERGGGLEPKQLCMVIDGVGVRGMPDVVIPAGYALRTYREGDEVTLAETLRSAGFVDWDVARVLGYLEDADRRAGSAVVEQGGAIVASTFASRMSSGSVSPVTGKSGEPWREGLLDYVATHTDHQGRGLGRATCTAVSRYLVNQGCETVLLFTDDWRLPAIHLYLSLGYRPVMHRSDMPERWAQVMDELEKHGHAHV